MAEKLKEVLKVEFDRNTPESRRKIFLFRDGSFLRPYEISCWMFQRFIFDGYKVSCRTYKGYKDPVCLIGFPPASLKKLLSVEKCKGIQQIGNTEETLETAADPIVELILPEELMPESYPADLFLEDYNAWKKKQKVQAPESDTHSCVQQTTHQKVTMMNIIQELLAFPLEKKSPLEAYMFLSEIRTKAASIF